MTKIELNEKLRDPVYAVVFQAVRSFSRETRRQDDFRIWLWYGNRLGHNTLLQLVFELEHEMETDRLERHRPVDNPAAVFHRRLQNIYRFYYRKEKGTRS